MNPQWNIAILAFFLLYTIIFSSNISCNPQKSQTNNRHPCYRVAVVGRNASKLLSLKPYLASIYIGPKSQDFPFAKLNSRFTHHNSQDKCQGQSSHKAVNKNRFIQL